MNKEKQILGDAFSMTGRGSIDPHLDSMVSVLANKLGIAPLKRGRFEPKFWYNRRCKKQMRKAVSKWQFVPPPIETTKIQIARELCDLADMVIGSCPINKDQRVVPRTARVSNLKIVKNIMDAGLASLKNKDSSRKIGSWPNPD